MTPDQVKTKEAMRLLAPDLENWIRWGRDKSHYPKSYLCILGLVVKSSDRDYEAVPEERKQAVRVQEAEMMEETISRLPRKQRQAFLLYTIGRAAINGRVRFAKGREDGAKAMRVGVWQYHNLIRQAADIVLRQWG